MIRDKLLTDEMQLLSDLKNFFTTKGKSPTLLEIKTFWVSLTESEKFDFMKELEKSKKR